MTKNDEEEKSNERSALLLNRPKFLIPYCNHYHCEKKFHIARPGNITRIIIIINVRKTNEAHSCSTALSQCNPSPHPAKVFSHNDNDDACDVILMTMMVLMTIVLMTIVLMTMVLMTMLMMMLMVAHADEQKLSTCPESNPSPP